MRMGTQQQQQQGPFEEKAKICLRKVWSVCFRELQFFCQTLLNDQLERSEIFLFHVKNKRLAYSVQ